MKQILAVITETDSCNVEVYSFPDMDTAHEFIRSKYLELIRSVDRYNFEDSYMNKKCNFAQVSSYNNVYRIKLCSNVKEISKNNQKSK